MTASSDSTVRQTKNKTCLNSSCYFNGIVFQLFCLTTILLIDTTVAAPLSDDLETSHQSQLSDYYGASPDSMTCYYNFQHYEEGDRIVTNEPCLNCTCHKRMLMCYLRVCPFTKAVGQNCTVEKRPDQCCPIITCPEVPVQLLTSSTTPAAPSTQSAVAPPDTFGCMLENAFYPDGAQVPSDPKNPCELCYCIRNRTACVLQECTLNVEGCKPVHQSGVCCPVRYDCDYEEASTSSETAVGTGLLLTTTQSPQQCNYHGQMFNDGELIPLTQSEGKSCERCYCMRGEIVCAVQDCGNPLEGKDCEPIPPPSGQCCPTTYMCANETVPVESLSRVSTPPPSVNDLSTTISSTDQETEEPSPSKQTLESDEPEEPVNEDTETDPMKSEEQETADSKQSGTQVIPEGEITKVTSVAETHTEISISTKQDEGTEVAVSSDTELTTLKPESEPEKSVDSISGQTDETTQHSSSVSVEMDEEKIAESTEKVVSYTTTMKYHSDPSSEDASSEELHVEMPHPIEIDEPEKTSEEHTTISSDKVNISTPVESDEADQGPLVISDREKDSTELPEETHIETELPDKHFPTESPVELGVSTDTDRDSTESSSTDRTISSTISPIAEDSNAGASINSETIADKNGIESITTQASVMTNQPEENVEVTPQSAETLAPITSLSNDQDETKDQDKTKDQDEKTTVSVVEENQTTKPDVVTEKLPIEASERPIEADLPEEDEIKPSVVEPVEPQAPELQVENDSVDESEDEPEPVPATDKSPTAETEKPVEEKLKPVAEDEVHPTTSPSISESESEKTITTAPVVKVDEEDVKISEHEITTASVVQSRPSEDQTVSFSEILNGESQTTPHTKVEFPSAEPTISNEISNDVDHQTSVPPHEEEIQSAVTQEITIEKGVIPGEGSCLVDGTTYPDGEIVPATNPCHTECKCHSSIIQCNMIDCPPPPPHMKNCMPVQHNDDTCCPMYSCDGEKDHPSLESDNQLGNIDTINNREKEETPVTEDESSGSFLPETVQTITTTLVPAVDDKPSEVSVIPEKEVSAEVSVTTEKDFIAQVEDKNKPEAGIMPGIVSPQLPGSIEHDEVSSEESPDEHNTPGIDASEITESNAVEPADIEKHVTESHHHIVSEDKIATISPFDSSTVTEKESVTHTDVGEVAVHSDVGDASAHAAVGEVGADFDVSEANAHSDASEGDTHTDVVETGAHTDVGEVGPDSDVGEAGPDSDEAEAGAHTDVGEAGANTDLGEAGAHTDLAEADAHTDVGEAGAHTDLAEAGAHTDLAEAGAHTDADEAGTHTDADEAGTHTDADEAGAHTDADEAGTHTDVGEAGAHTDVGEADAPTDVGDAGAHTDLAETGGHTLVPEIGAHTDVPEAGAHTDVPEAGAHADVPEAGAHIDVPEAGAHTEVPEAGTYTDITEAGAHSDVGETGTHTDLGEAGAQTDIGEVDASTEAVLSPDQEEEHISQQQHGSEPAPTTAESIKDSVEHDESHESGHTPEEGSSPELVVHQETTVALSDVTSIPDTTSKFEEIDIPDSTSVPEILPQEIEQTSTKLSIPSIIEITTEDQPSISSVTVDQTITESALEEEKEKMHELLTTAPIESVSGIQGNIEEQIPVTTQSPLKDKLESTNNVLGPLSGLPGGTEDDSSSENDQVESQVDTETSPQPDEIKSQVDTETSAQPDEIKSQVDTETSAQPDEIKSQVDTETSPQPDEITPKPADQEIPAEHAASSETIVDREKTEDEEVEHISLNTDIPVVVDTTEAVGGSIEDDKHHEIVTEDTDNVITQQPETYIESEPTLKPQDEVSSSEQLPAEEITSEGVDDHQVVHEIPEESWGVTSDKSETEKHVAEEHTTEPSQLNQEQDGTEKNQEHEPEQQHEHEPEHQERPEHEPEHQDEHEPEKHEEHGLETTTEQKDHVEEQSLIHDHTSDESTVVASEKTPVESNQEMEGDKKQGTEAEATKPSVIKQSSESNESLRPSSEEETKPEEVEIRTTTSSSTQSPFDLTTKFIPLISSEPIGIVAGELPSNTFSHMPMPGWTQKPFRPELTTEASVSEEEQQPFQPSGGDLEYEEEEESSFGPGTCRYGGKVFVSAQQVPRDNPCDFCFCFRGDIICLQQSCPPPIHGCRQESIQGFCCPRYECPVSMANSLNLTTTTTTTTTTLPPHFFSHAAYRGAARRSGCQVQGHAYKVGEEITSASGPCLHCMCGASGQMKCDPKVCSPEPMLRKMIEAAVRRRR
ncbi:tenectin [Lycorma delicatula]|uniref:tenectin n=1 Tax=Lycorma delicatula TaxID=130591 RepID=UPI003F51571D